MAPSDGMSKGLVAMRAMAVTAMMSVIVYLNVAWYLVTRDSATPKPNSDLTAFLSAEFGAIAAIAIFFLHSRMVRFARRIGAGYFIVFLVSYTAFEWMSICGLVGTMLTMQFRWVAGCGLLALVAMALRFPRSEACEQFPTEPLT